MCYLKCSGAVSMFHFVHSLICVDTATMKLQRHFMNRLAKHIAKTLLLYLVMYFNVDLFCIDLQNRVQYTTKTVSLNHTSLFIHPKIHPFLSPHQPSPRRHSRLRRPSSSSPTLLHQPPPHRRPWQLWLHRRRSRRSHAIYRMQTYQIGGRDIIGGYQIRYGGLLAQF